MKKVKVTKLLNKRTLKFLGLLATLLTVCAAVVSALGALLMVQQLRLAALERRALPVLEKAAQLYLDQNAPSQGPQPSRHRRYFHGKDTVPTTPQGESERPV